MPSLKRTTSQNATEAKPFGVYDGDEPTPGNYPGVIRSAAVRTFGTGTMALNILVELYAEPGSPKAAYNGYPCWAQMFLGEHEYQVGVEKAFYKAVVGKEDVDIVLATERTQVGEGYDEKIEKISGVDIVGTPVRVDIRRERQAQAGYEKRLRGEAIYAATEGQAIPEGAKPVRKTGSASSVPGGVPGGAPAPAKKAAAKKAAPAKAAEPAPEVPQTQQDQVVITGQAAETDVDYHGLSLPKLKLFAKDMEVDAQGSKQDILARLDAHFGEGETAGDDSADGVVWGVDPGQTTPNRAQILAAPAAKVQAYVDSVYGEDQVSLESEGIEAIADMLVEDEMATPF